MGLCNLKWTSKEEASLKDAILKHGPGKWADILKDPQFRNVLRARSNVDLKDKWRNMQLAKNGEPRNSCMTVQKNVKMTSGQCAKPVALISEGCDEDKIAEPEPPSSFNEASQEGGSEKLTRFDACKVEDLTDVKKPSSLTKIQESCHISNDLQKPLPPLNLDKFSLENIKSVAVDEKLIESVINFLILVTPSRQEAVSYSFKQGMECDSAYTNSRWAEINAELMMIAQMSPEDAAAAAVAAVKKAEAALAEAEEAAKEAEEAEIAAEEAKDFAEQLRKETREKMKTQLTQHLKEESAVAVSAEVLE
ncbi:MYB transcription factor [Heracleum sosnowskyi]|uniref:MYB transcription factor n=1 Tax=Heracleum sosnowskyi TaxID=360622 RepID=A0AAD8HAX4_9APIA|nr:MYB transcription factor [Heracleum sosnowskyi]